MEYLLALGRESRYDERKNEEEAVKWRKRQEEIPEDGSFPQPGSFSMNRDTKILR
jgi:hypothetical protein